MSLLALLALVAAEVALAWTRALFAQGAAAIALQVMAAALMMWARATFGLRSFHAGADPTSGGLVTGGPYRFVRHPIYAAVLLFTWAGVLTHLSPTALALAGVATAMTVVRLLAEEQLVARRYPEYADYARRTRRLVPYLL